MQTGPPGAISTLLVTLPKCKEKNELCRFEQVKIIKVKPRVQAVSEDVNLGYNFSTEGVY